MLALALLLAACGPGAGPASLPTARIIQASAAPARVAVIPTTAPTTPPTATPPPVPTATPQPATPHDQYRAWMEEARALHPYAESIEAMWEVMICESSGNPEMVAGPHHGLFQYHPTTWAGDWNPYRDRPILDAHAQIFATAKAWQDGYQGWWGCYRG